MQYILVKAYDENGIAAESPVFINGTHNGATGQPIMLSEGDGIEVAVVVQGVRMLETIDLEGTTPVRPRKIVFGEPITPENEGGDNSTITTLNAYSLRTYLDHKIREHRENIASSLVAFDRKPSEGAMIDALKDVRSHFFGEQS